MPQVNAKWSQLVSSGLIGIGSVAAIYWIGMIGQLANIHALLWPGLRLANLVVHVGVEGQGGNRWMSLGLALDASFYFLLALLILQFRSKQTLPR